MKTKRIRVLLKTSLVFALGVSVLLPLARGFGTETSLPTSEVQEVTKASPLPAGEGLISPESQPLPLPGGTYRFSQRVEGRLLDGARLGALGGPPLAPSLDVVGTLAVEELPTTSSSPSNGTRVFRIALRPTRVEFRQVSSGRASSLGVGSGFEFLARVTLTRGGKIESMSGSRSWPTPVTVAAHDLLVFAFSGTPGREPLTVEERAARVCPREGSALCGLRVRYGWTSRQDGVDVARSQGFLEAERISARAEVRGGGDSLVPLAAFPKESEFEETLARSTLGQDVYETLAPRIDDLDARGIREGGERARLARKVVALVRLYPGTVAAFVDRIRTSRPGSFSRLAVTGALAEVGHDAAQKGLLELATDEKLPEDLRATVIGSFHHVKTPSASTVSGVVDIANADGSRNVRTMSRLLVGTLAGRLDVRDADAARLVLDRLQNDLENASSPAHTRFALAVLGNTGHLSVHTVVTARLRDEDALTRAAAALALRDVPGRDVDEALLRTFESETEENVREALLRAFASRTPRADDVSRLANLAASSPDHSVRRAMLLTLLKWRDDGFDVEESLKGFLAREKVASIRRLETGR
jgi:hypothetical protein